ncbi:MAG: helix-turn-helix domain-containing protein [Chitinophagales bacterium]
MNKKLEELITAKYGDKSTPERQLFEAKSTSFYLCNMIAEWRKEKKWTQKKMAEHIGVKPEFLSRIENGKVDVQLSTFIKILNCLGKSIEVK